VVVTGDRFVLPPRRLSFVEGVVADANRAADVRGANVRSDHGVRAKNHRMTTETIPTE
jgi:hypothetical protein